nr:AAA family ATPase [Candidatus Aminicenantes bacterium]NIN91042.1 AAA family ATPase [Candidatus Aminicenantes bacterium]NIO87831.1 AAA family ATPase [Candidatus Aminicenantes bacterium]NIR12034.1 AAA family ATPase [Candidatus Aminicenantes bacterium]NIT29675.1 AAA family ATPase [Candidatus Aminicenantes bacterium]
MLRYNKSKFVGRKHEQSIFSQYIEVIHSPVPILDVYGPGGIGKTSLLECFNNIASENKSLVLKVDLEGSKTILDILFTLTSSVKTQKFKNFKAAKKRWNKIWEKVADVSHPKFQRISSLSK